MPIIDAARRKKRLRTRSPSRSHLPPVSKHPRVNNLWHDGTGSHKSMESSSTGRSSLSTVVREKCKKVGSSIMTIVLDKFDKHNEPHNSLKPAEHASLAVIKSGLGAGFTHPNDSNATTVVTTPLKLTLRGESEQAELGAIHSAPTTPGNRDPAREDLFSAGAHQQQPTKGRRELKRSISSPSIHSKISQKLFGTPTVVRRSDLKSRPSVYSLPTKGGQPSWVTTQFSSSPSTYNSDSGSTPNGVHITQTSTPPTSDTTPSPRSATYHEGIASGNQDSGLWISHDFSAQSKLTSIPEGAVMPIGTVVTVEATATAKIFFETHFNALMRSPDARQSRRWELEHRMSELQLPIAVEFRTRKAWAIHESHNLRLYRTMKAAFLSKKRRDTVSVGGYEVVKILGKGSFGVVRLVREKQNVPTAGRSSSALNLLHSSKSTLQNSAKDASNPTPHRRMDPAKVKTEVYAMKVIRKSDMLRNSQEGHLRAERDLLVAAEGSQWIVPLLAAFQDTKFLYLVMDFCIGGDFLGLLIRKNILSEEITKWYVAEMVLCVEEAHRMKWIHRDVKPDNFLIGADGHLKISDFGLAFDGRWDHDQNFYHKHRKDLMEKLKIEVPGDEQDQQEQVALENANRIAGVWPGSCAKSSKPEPCNNKEEVTEPILDWRERTQNRRLARSVVGTSQYMAPEVIRGDMYDGRCDWWSIGVIMYECLYGYTPFACEDRHNTKLKILKHKQTLKFPHAEPPREPSVDALDLMVQLLVEKEKRICSRKYELNDFTRKAVGSKFVKFVADKTHRSYEGRFVYADDAEDIKKHPFFRTIKWETVSKKRPPFVPRVKSSEDTKYFDDEQTISDIDSASSDVDDALQMQDAKTVVASQDGLLSSEGTRIGSQASHHYHEDQHIVPSSALKLNVKNGDSTVTTPLLADVPIQACNHAMEWKVEKLDEHSPHSYPVNPPKSPKKKKEKKRARDKVLRDPIAGPMVMNMRKEGAFIGYAYRKPQAVDEVIKEVLENERITVKDSEGAETQRHFSPVAMNDYGHEKRVYLEHGGKMVRAKG